MKNITRCCCLSLICLLMTAAEMRPALAELSDIVSLKVAYIYNIAKFTRWPEMTWSSPDDPFQLCFYGEGGVNDALQKLSGKKVNGHPVALLKPQNEDAFQECNAFYINTTERFRYRYLLSLIDPEKVLVISDDSSFFDSGGLINLVEQDRRLRFEVNTRELELSELQFSSKLLQLAILVDKPRQPQ